VLQLREAVERATIVRRVEAEIEEQLSLMAKTRREESAKVTKWQVRIHCDVSFAVHGIAGCKCKSMSYRL
jgi:hypothetical protein